MIGQNGPLGAAPAKLHPIFRDRSDLSGGGRLSDKIQSVLHDSESLIVLCSPAAASSEWVNRECEVFIGRGATARIFPVIAPLAGEHDDLETACFPPALRGLGLLAADLREIRHPTGRIVGDGKEGGRLKLIAGLLGVDLDTLVRRERRRQRALLIAVSAAAAVFAIVAVVAVVQTIGEARQRALAVTERERAEFSLARFVTERAWAALEGGKTATAARYALLAGSRFPQRRDLAGEVLSRIRRETVTPVSELEADGRLLSAQWTSGGARVVRLTTARAIEVWALNPNRKLHEHALAQNEEVCAANANVALVCQDNVLSRSLSLGTGRVLATFSSDVAHVTPPIISMDGARSLTLGGGRARIWDVQTGALIESHAFITSAAENSAHQIALSANGRVAMAVRSRSPAAAMVWQVGAPASVRRFPEALSEQPDFGPPADVVCHAVTSTPWAHEFVFSCADRSQGYEDMAIQIRPSGFEVWGGPELYGFRGAGPGNMFGFAEPTLTSGFFAPQSRQAAHFYADYETRGETRATMTELHAPAARLQLYPDGRIILAPRTGVPREIVMPGLSSAAFSSDGGLFLLAAADGAARVYDVGQALIAPIVTGRFADFTRSHPRGPAFSGDGNYLVAMRNVDSDVLLLDIANAQSHVLPTFNFERDEMFAGVRARNGVDRLLFREGALYASTFGGDRIHAWPLASPGERREIQAAPATRELFDAVQQEGLQLIADTPTDAASPDGRLTLGIRQDGAVSLRSRESGFELAAFRSTGESPVVVARFSPDGRRLATMSANGEVAVWDLSGFSASFEDLAAWTCQRLLTNDVAREFSEEEIAQDPLLRELAPITAQDLCA
jgi:WD40 repeat protein